MLRHETPTSTNGERNSRKTGQGKPREGDIRGQGDDAMTAGARDAMRLMVSACAPVMVFPPFFQVSFLYILY